MTKILETVQVVKLDTMTLGVNLYVLCLVLEVAVKTVDIVIVYLDTGGINVKIRVQVTVKMMNVTKTLEAVLEDVSITCIMDQNVRTPVPAVTNVMKMESVLMVLD